MRKEVVALGLAGLLQLWSAAPGALTAQGIRGSLSASATVVEAPATIRAVGRPRGVALEATDAAWRLSGRPMAVVGVTFAPPDTLMPGGAESGPPLPLAPGPAAGRWQRPGEVTARGFDARTGATVVTGSAADPSVFVALAWTPRPVRPVPPGLYVGSLVMTLAYY